MPGFEQQHDQIEQSNKPETADDILNKLDEKETNSLMEESKKGAQEILEQNLDIKEALDGKVNMNEIADAFAKNVNSILSEKTDLTPDEVKVVDDDIKEKLENAENLEVLREMLIEPLSNLPVDI